MNLKLISTAVVGFGVAALIGPCSSLSPSSLVSTGVSAAIASPALVDALNKCEASSKAEVQIAEERTVGGALAVSFVSSAGGLALKPYTTDTNALLDASKIKIPSTPIAELNRYVTVVGKLVAAQSSRPDLPWTFGVLESPDVNAFSTPGGYVLVSRGLLAHLDNEAQLAGILGHEIAHITQRDHVRAYQRRKEDVCKTVAQLHFAQDSHAAQNLIPVPSELVGPLWALMEAMNSHGGALDLDNADGPVLKYLLNGFAETFLSSGFARDQEFTADRIGLELAMRAGYQGGEFMNVMAKLPAGAGLFAKHPEPKERSAKLAEALDALKHDPFESTIVVSAIAVVPHPRELKVASGK